MQPAGEWKTRVREAFDAHRGKYVPAAMLTKIKRSICKRVQDRAAVEATIANELERRKLNTPSGTTQVTTTKKKQKTRSVPSDGTKAITWKMATPAARAAAIAKDSPHAAFYDTYQRVERWVRENTEGAVGTVTFSVPMMSRMKKSIAKAGRTAQMVEAAFVMLLQHYDMRMEWHSRGQGGRHRKVWAEVLDTLRQEGGLTRLEALDIFKAIVNKTTHLTMTDPVILDFATGWEGTKTGFSRVARTYGLDICRQRKGAKEGWTVLDMKMDMAADREDIQHTARKVAGVNQQAHMASHFSPPCEARTLLMYLEATQGRGQGRHLGEEESEEDSKMIKAIVDSIVLQEQENPAWSFTLEQPEGTALLHNDIMMPLGTPRRVNMCAYGYKHQKPTVLWTNLGEYWTPRDSKTVCQHCRDITPHKERILRKNADAHRSGPTQEGFTHEAMRNRVAPDLAEELAKAMLAKWMDHQ